MIFISNYTMKNSTIRSFFSILPLLFGLMIMLSSCSENMHSPITKRHYRKGFHVDFAHKVKPATAVKTEELEELEANDTAMLKSEQQIDANSQALYASTDEDFSQFITPHKTVKPIASVLSVKKILPIKTVVSNLKKPMTKVKRAVKASAPTHDALSLLWLVILILLILWLIAFFTGGWGLGGLIHLFLLIALILLILWLLKII